MEDNGIGRPSTYASIIDTLKSRAYVTTQRGYLSPTEQGILTNDKLQDYFNTIINIDYTAQMESNLDEIAINKIAKLDVLHKFYDDFITLYHNADHSMEVVAAKEVGELCPLCNSPLLYRHGKYSEFIGCSNYPSCNYIKKEIPANAKKCPECATGYLLIKKGKYGSFLGCSNYPECKHMEKLNKYKKDFKKD